MPVARFWAPSASAAENQTKIAPAARPDSQRYTAERAGCLGFEDARSRGAGPLAMTSQRDYSLIGPSAQAAEEQGLVAAEWYHAEVPRKRMKQLMRRCDGPALRDSAVWVGLLAAFGFAGGWFWGSWLCVPFFIV